MADDEDRRLEPHAGNPAPVEEALQAVQDGVHEREKHRRDDDVNAPDGGSDREAVPGQKGEQRRRVHAVPDAADPPRIGVMRRTHSPIFQADDRPRRRNAGALSTPPLTYCRCKTPPKSPPTRCSGRMPLPRRAISPARQTSAAPCWPAPLSMSTHFSCSEPSRESSDITRKRQGIWSRRSGSARKRKFSARTEISFWNSNATAKRSMLFPRRSGCSRGTRTR